jgi:NADH-quinone oxidoreductase subunit G
VGSNPRKEAPVLNARLRRAHVSGGAVVANIGAPLELSFPVEELGMSASTIDDFVSGKHPFTKVLQVRDRIQRPADPPFAFLAVSSLSCLLQPAPSAGS